MPPGMSAPSPRPPASRLARALFSDRRAATAVEYGFILALVTLAALAAISQVGNVTTGMWNRIASKVINPS